jgi:3-phenylpropionate/trans-cinnamate dioxygenase ferredoxin subunit
MTNWVRACATSDFGDRSVLRFDHGERTFAIYRSPEGAFYATDGHCTHEQTHLADGAVFGHEIECPRHLGAFDYTTGEAVLAPACVDLKTFAVRSEGNAVLIDIDS